MKSKRILIVDDEPNVAIMLSDSLERYEEECNFEVAHSGHEALAKVEQNSYDIIITDYAMPGMTGLDLIQAIRQISPHTQVIMMTAHGTDHLRETVKHIDLDGYIDKPFTIQEIREIVEQAIARTNNTGLETDPYRSGERILNQDILKQLKSLQANTGARCVLLLSASGYPVNVTGPTKDLDITSISALVAANFMAAAELANLLGNHSSIFKSSYHEGNDYNIYAYEINKELLLAVIFDSDSKPGVIWFYTKQTAAELEPLLAANQADDKPIFQENDLGATLDAELGKLFDTPQADGYNGSNSEITDSTNHQNEPNQAPQNEANEVKKPMTFEQAVAAGLVPSEILRREQD